MITLKSAEEIKLLREGGKILSDILHEVAKRAVAGVTTGELDAMAEEMIVAKGGEPSFKNYSEDGDNPYPATLCTSVNNQVVHGIPDDYILKNGDIVGLDIGMRYPKKTGLFTDMAVTVIVGKPDKRVKELVEVTKKSLDLWIKNVKAGRRLNEIGRIVQDYIEKNNFSVVRDLVGHGVGHAVHEDPPIPNYFIASFNTELKEGMVLAIEPMVTMGDYRVRTLSDGWTIVTADKSLCAHFEHTLVVTKNGCDVLTR
jgi:methionyl aminopeptidase